MTEYRVTLTEPTTRTCEAWVGRLPRGGIRMSDECRPNLTHRVREAIRRSNEFPDVHDYSEQTDDALNSVVAELAPTGPTLMEGLEALDAIASDLLGSRAMCYLTDWLKRHFYEFAKEWVPEDPGNAWDPFAAEEASS